MKPHNDGHYFVPGSRQTGRYEPRGFMVGSYAKPTLTEQGIDVDEFIRENHARIQRLRETTPRSGIPVGAAIACDPRKPLEHDQKRDEVFDTFKHLSQSQKGNVSASDVARTLRMPKSTVLYQMNNLLMLGMLDRHGHTWTLKTRKDAR